MARLQRTVGNQALQSQAQPSNGTPSIDGQLPDVNVESVYVRFTVPGERLLQETWQYDLETTRNTDITLRVMHDKVVLSARPPLFVDALWPAKNLTIVSATYDFTTARATAVSGDAGMGLTSYKEEAEAEVAAILATAINGTPAGVAGYNPFKDTKLSGTLQSISANIQAYINSLPPSDEEAPIALKEVTSPAIGATIRMKSKIERQADSAALVIESGGAVTIEAEGTGNLGAIMSGKTTQAQALATGLQSVSVTSDAITITRKGKPLARLEKLTLWKGGKVTVDKMTPLGDLETAEDVERIGWLTGLLLLFGSKGASTGQALRLAGNTRDPTHVVKNLATEKIEKSLSEAITALILENRTSIPGVDLATIFGVTPRVTSPTK